MLSQKKDFYLLSRRSLISKMSEPTASYESGSQSITSNTKLLCITGTLIGILKVWFQMAASSSTPFYKIDYY